MQITENESRNHNLSWLTEQMYWAGSSHDVLYAPSKHKQAAPVCSDPEVQDKISGTSIDSLGYKI